MNKHFGKSLMRPRRWRTWLVMWVLITLMLVAEINDGGKVGEPDDLVVGFFALFGWVIPLAMYIRMKRTTGEEMSDDHLDH